MKYLVIVLISFFFISTARAENSDPSNGPDKQPANEQGQSESSDDEPSQDLENVELLVTCGSPDESLAGSDIYFFADRSEKNAELHVFYPDDSEEIYAADLDPETVKNIRDGWSTYLNFLSAEEGGSSVSLTLNTSSEIEDVANSTLLVNAEEKSLTCRIAQAQY